MVIVKFQGGLGNQMFQYGLYRKLSCLGKEVKADVSWFKNNKAESPRDFDLLQFPIHLDICNHLERIVYKNFLTKFLCNYTSKQSLLYIEKESGKYVPEIIGMNNIYLDGYWQSEKYFKDIRDILVRDFLFPEPVSSWEREMYYQIKKTNSVAIHIRRGDYLKHSDQFGDICTSKYYLGAISVIREKLKDPVFFVFSDDLLWSKEFLQNQIDVHFIDLGNDTNCIHDMKLMAACKHNIIANSSFSWWASWLNQNDEKIVIAPTKWQNKKACPDIRCNNWTPIEIM